MLKTLGAQIKEYKWASIATPVFMLLEVAVDTIIPLLMASIIDNGVNMGDTRHIYIMGVCMIVAALFGLLTGCLGAKYGAKAAMGFGKNLRAAMFRNIQTFSFANIDRFSSASLVTRMTTDVTNIQNAYMMLLRMAMRAPASIICAMAMSFFISPRLATIYLIAVIVLGALLLFISKAAMKYFDRAFKRYDDLNESVQENVSAIRVVKAYVREDHETSKFHKAAENIYKIFDLYEQYDSLTMTETELLRQGIKTKTGRSFTRFSIKSILQNPVYLIADKDAYQYFVDNEAELFSPESDFDGIPAQSQEKGQAILHKLK